MSLFLIFLALIAAGIPIAIAMGMVPFGYVIISGDFPITMLSYKMFDAIDNFCLIAVPLFILGGNLITQIGMTQKLVAFSNELVGRITGGLSHVNVVVSTLFGGLNGSAVGDAAAVGSILIKPMREAGFSKAYSAAVTAASGTISGIIPPSVPFIIFATAVPHMSIGALFVGGIVPGVMVCLLQCLAGYFISKHRHYPKITEPFHFSSFWKVSLEAVPALILVGIIIFGLRGGVFTPTEAGSIIVIYALLFGFVIYRTLNLKSFFSILRETAVTTGVIFLVIGSAGPFMWLLTRMGATQTLTQSLLSLTSNPVLWWVLVAIFLLIAGMVMDTVANLLILSPIVFLAAKNMGFDPFVSSIAIVILLIVGTSSPPVGISLFVTCAIAEERIEKASLDVIPFLLGPIIVVAILLCFPELAKIVPRLFGFMV